MAGTVDLPAIGRVKSGYVWGGAAVVVVAVGYFWIRNRNAAASGATAGTAADTTTLDPETGYPEGSPEDLAALQAQSGGAYGGVGGGYAGEGTGYTGQEYYYDPADGLYDLTSPYTGASSGTSNSGPGTFTDNAYWVQYAIENVQGYSAGQIQGALSAYLAGMGLTTTQMSIYQASVAVAGSPPDPPKSPAHLQNGTGTGGGSTGSGTQVTVPDVISEDLVNAQRAIGEQGLKSAVSGPATTRTGEVRTVSAQSPAGGTKVDAGTTVRLTYKIANPPAKKK
ncbi:MAG TPA: PASTA domain-containing protein [Trebonia sp.]|jgi:hypothetical protein|nr:PASTA domain-containing protein [Trebonia sp.]